jgi:methylphosphotriester-DNA--protein-cysteine methyltransferase
VKKAIRYLLLKDEEFVADIVSAIDKANTKKMIEDAKSEIIAEITPSLRQQFQLELTQYADAIEAEKAREVLRAQEIANQQTTTIPLDLV